MVPSVGGGDTLINEVLPIDYQLTEMMRHQLVRLILKKYARFWMKCKEPVIHVGHSNGVVVNQSAEQRTEKIKSLVYVSEFLLKND